MNILDNSKQTCDNPIDYYDGLKEIESAQKTNNRIIKMNQFQFQSQTIPQNQNDTSLVLQDKEVQDLGHQDIVIEAGPHEYFLQAVNDQAMSSDNLEASLKDPTDCCLLPNPSSYHAAKNSPSKANSSLTSRVKRQLKGKKMKTAKIGGNFSAFGPTEMKHLYDTYNPSSKHKENATSGPSGKNRVGSVSKRGAIFSNKSSLLKLALNNPNQAKRKIDNFQDKKQIQQTGALTCQLRSSSQLPQAVLSNSNIDCIEPGSAVTVGIKNKKKSLESMIESAGTKTMQKKKKSNFKVREFSGGDDSVKKESLELECGMPLQIHVNDSDSYTHQRICVQKKETGRFKTQESNKTLTLPNPKGQKPCNQSRIKNQTNNLNQNSLIEQPEVETQLNFRIKKNQKITSSNEKCLNLENKSAQPTIQKQLGAQYTGSISNPKMKLNGLKNSQEGANEQIIFNKQSSNNHQFQQIQNTDLEIHTMSKNLKGQFSMITTGPVMEQSALNSYVCEQDAQQQTIRELVGSGCPSDVLQFNDILRQSSQSQLVHRDRYHFSSAKIDYAGHPMALENSTRFQENYQDFTINDSKSCEPATKPQNTNLAQVSEKNSLIHNQATSVGQTQKQQDDKEDLLISQPSKKYFENDSMKHTTVPSQLVRSLPAGAKTMVVTSQKAQYHISNRKSKMIAETLKPNQVIFNTNNKKQREHQSSKFKSRFNNRNYNQATKVSQNKDLEESQSSGCETVGIQINTQHTDNQYLNFMGQRNASRQGKETKSRIVSAYQDNNDQSKTQSPINLKQEKYSIADYQDKNSTKDIVDTINISKNLSKKVVIRGGGGSCTAGMSDFPSNDSYLKKYKVYVTRRQSSSFSRKKEMGIQGEQVNSRRDSKHQDKPIASNTIFLGNNKAFIRNSKVNRHSRQSVFPDKSNVSQTMQGKQTGVVVSQSNMATLSKPESMPGLNPNLTQISQSSDQNTSPIQKIQTKQQETNQIANLQINGSQSRDDQNYEFNSGHNNNLIGDKGQDCREDHLQNETPYEQERETKILKPSLQNSSEKIRFIRANSADSDEQILITADPYENDVQDVSHDIYKRNPHAQQLLKIIRSFEKPIDNQIQKKQLTTGASISEDLFLKNCKNFDKQLLNLSSDISQKINQSKLSIIRSINNADRSLQVSNRKKKKVSLKPQAAGPGVNQNQGSILDLEQVLGVDSKQRSNCKTRESPTIGQKGLIYITGQNLIAEQAHNNNLTSKLPQPAEINYLKVNGSRKQKIKSKQTDIAKSASKNQKFMKPLQFPINETEIDDIEHSIALYGSENINQVAEKVQIQLDNLAKQSLLNEKERRKEHFELLKKSRALNKASLILVTGQNNKTDVNNSPQAKAKFSQSLNRNKTVADVPGSQNSSTKGNKWYGSGTSNFGSITNTIPIDDQKKSLNVNYKQFSAPSKHSIHEQKRNSQPQAAFNETNKGENDDFKQVGKRELPGIVEKIDKKMTNKSISKVKLGSINRKKSDDLIQSSAPPSQLTQKKEKLLFNQVMNKFNGAYDQLDNKLDELNNQVDSLRFYQSKYGRMITQYQNNSQNPHQGRGYHRTGRSLPQNGNHVVMFEGNSSLKQEKKYIIASDKYHEGPGRETLCVRFAQDSISANGMDGEGTPQVSGKIQDNGFTNKVQNSMHASFVYSNQHKKSHEKSTFHSRNFRQNKNDVHKNKLYDIQTNEKSGRTSILGTSSLIQERGTSARDINEKESRTVGMHKKKVVQFNLPEID